MVTMENKLFGFYLGGYVSGCNIELHDVIFSVSDSIENSYEQLKKKWFGYPESTPHIDAYLELSSIDGFKIELSKKNESLEDWRLYFINFGAYKDHVFSEIHQSAFYVSKNKTEAIQKARKELCHGMIKPHLDDVLDVKELIAGDFEIEDVIEITNVDGYSIACIPEKGAKHPIIHTGRIKLK